MSSFTPNILRPATDRDALFVLFISFLVMFASFGALFMFLLFRVIKKAKNTPALINFPTSVFLVFGKRLQNNKPDPEYQSRLNRLINCKYQSVILMGGKTADAEVSEAQAGYNYLIQKGLKPDSIHLEQHSQNTLENLKNSRQLFDKKKVVIISNRYHLARCSALASSLGICHQVCAAENNFQFNFKTLLKCLFEAFYLHWFFSGKYWATLTHNQRMIDKIS